jgi:hypothetical protein
MQRSLRGIIGLFGKGDSLKNLVHRAALSHFRRRFNPEPGIPR